MKKAIILGTLAFFAINIACIQDANAQVNKQREQMLQSVNDTSGASDQAKTTTKIKKVQKVTPVNKQREQMLQPTNVVEQEHPDLVSKLYIKHDTIYLEKKKAIEQTEQTDRTVKKKKILVKSKKESEIDQTEQTEKHP